MAFVAVGGGLDGVEQDAQRHLVVVLHLERHCAVLGEAHLGVIPGEYRHVRAGHTQQAAVTRHRLHRRVQKGNHRAVRVEVDHIKVLVWILVLVHEHARIAVVYNDFLGIYPIELYIHHRCSSSFGQQIVDDNIPYIGYFLHVANRTQASGSQSIQYSNSLQRDKRRSVCSTRICIVLCLLGLVFSLTLFGHNFRKQFYDLDRQITV